MSLAKLFNLSQVDRLASEINLIKQPNLGQITLGQNNFLVQQFKLG
jgi:hypothetical protein